MVFVQATIKGHHNSFSKITLFLIKLSTSVHFCITFKGMVCICKNGVSSQVISSE